jgi:hypothetical protein
MERRGVTFGAVLLWVLGIVVWSVVALEFSRSTGFASRLQPILIMAALTFVIRYLIRRRANASALAVLLTPILAVVVLLVVASWSR